MPPSSGRANVHLTPPAPYPEFVWLMDRATLILTDSGGVQEEAPSLGKPVLVMRESTERPEALASGAVELVGTSVDRIVARVTTGSNGRHGDRPRGHDPGRPIRIGDGHAAGPDRAIDLPPLTLAWSSPIGQPRLGFSQLPADNFGHTAGNRHSRRRVVMLSSGPHGSRCAASLLRLCKPPASHAV